MDEKQNSFNIFVEIPKGSSQKFEFDEDLKMIKLDRVLYESFFFPFEYGYILNTMGEDGDPLDALLFSTYPTFPGCVVEARAIGLILMEDESGIDNKVVAVPGDKIDPRFKEIREIDDLPSHTREEIKFFFENYKKLEKEKWVKLAGFKDSLSAQELIKKSWVSN
ncbi:MAG: inorganic diphosphatase [Candidatus Pacebacteria bacterium]|nr:inorganic diphosphatase [Candidatus Paceibacterota bacterium]